MKKIAFFLVLASFVLAACGVQLPGQQPEAAAPVEAPIGSAECNAFKENEQAPLSGQPRTGFDMTVGSPYHRQVVNVWKAPDGKEVSILLPAIPTQHEILKGYYGHLWQYPTGTGCDSNNLVADAVNYARAKGHDHHTGQVWTLEAYLNGAEPLVKDAFSVDVANLPPDPTK